MKLWQVGVNGKWEYHKADRVRVTDAGDLVGEQLVHRGQDEEYVLVWAWARGLWATAYPVDQVKEAQLIS